MSSDGNDGPTTDLPAIVAITASAGRTGSLRSLLERLPPPDGAAVLLALQHREALDEDRFREAVAAAGHDLTEAADGTPVQPGRLYLPGPGQIATLNAGRIQLRPTSQAPGDRGVIDSFLVSLARAAGDRAIVVTLDGTDGDGTLGVTEIKAAGGIALAEETGESRAGGLSDSSSPAALADAILPADELAERLTSILAQVSARAAPAAPDSAGMTEALGTIASILRNRTGHDFHGYKPGTFMRRVTRRMQVRQIGTVQDYVAMLRTDADEAQDLFNDLLIGVTEFFRDKREWDLVEREVIPRLFEGKAAADALRVWVVGCSTGEEAYSLAILLAEHRASVENPPQIQIFASDLDGRALAAARSGRYPDRIAKQMTPERLGRWFLHEGDTYCVGKELREMCVFSQHSVIRDAPFSRLDFVSCRNLLIYLDAELQEQVIPLFHFALRPGGFLFLGNSENASRHTDLFAHVEAHSRLFRRLDKAARLPPVFPFTSVDRRRLSRSAPPPLPEPPRSDAAAADLTRWGERVMERHSPAYVILDADHNVLHFAGNVGRVLAPSRGAASLNLLQLIHPSLRLHLRTALTRATEEGRAVEARGLDVGTDPQRFTVDLIVEPRQRAADGPAGFVVLFKDSSARSESGGAEAGGPAGLAGPEQAAHILHLEDDLRTTRHRLQAAVEELETTNEELKSSNEEYQSLNEELQSANEELETSKEELQSMNEELTTVNGELAHRVQELGRANSDLRNFLESTQIATLFLDANLRVMNFTPAIMDVFHLVEADEGRPIGHIKPRVTYDGLQDDARRVLRTLAPMEREVDNQATGARYIARVLPYRSTDNVIAGVVVTFVDVTARRQAEESLRRSEERFRAIVETARDYAIFTTDTAGRINTWPPGAEDVFGWSDGEAVGQTLDITFTAEDREAGVPAQERAQAAETGQAPDIRWHVRKDGTRVFIDGMMRPLLGERGEPTGFLKVGQDRTEPRATAAALAESEDRFRSFVEASSDVLWILDAGTGRLEYLSPAFDRIWGEQRESVMADGGRLAWAVLADDLPAAEASRDRGLAGEHATVEYRIRRPDGDIRHIHDTIFPIFGDDGRVRRVAGVAQDITDRRRTELALESSRRRLRTLVEGIPQLVWRAGEGGQWTWASPQWSAFTGQSVDDSLGRGWLAMIHPDDRETIMRAWDQAPSQQDLDCEIRIRDAGSNGYRWFQSRAAPVHDDSGGIVEWLGTSTDVQQIKSLQEHQAVLVAELQHRTRNLLAVVHGLMDQTRRESRGIEEFMPLFQARLRALARVQILLSRLGEDGRVMFDDLVRTELEAMGALDADGRGERVTLEGPRGVRLQSSAVQTFALA
ncbi:PAS domain S-box protein, partial [Paracoccus sp. Z118]|uniref:CheR family methyltransferase n=1 Tax=Paracoccus sp. Z118 TaxID=2851017 RepID=UPI001C2C2401